MIFTVEYVKNSNDDQQGEVKIYCDREGIKFFISKLLYLQDEPGHEHFMTPSWAGGELTEEKQGGPENILINHLRVAVKPGDFEA